MCKYRCIFQQISEWCPCCFENFETWHIYMLNLDHFSLPDHHWHWRTSTLMQNITNVNVELIRQPKGQNWPTVPPLHGKIHLKFPFWLLEPFPNPTLNSDFSQNIVASASEKMTAESILNIFIWCSDSRPASMRSATSLRWSWTALSFPPRSSDLALSPYWMTSKVSKTRCHSASGSKMQTFPPRKSRQRPP